jgi:hypothetical protein
MVRMDVARVAILREILADTGWVDLTRSFARTLRSVTREPDGLLLVGTEREEPWHLAAHLDDEARFAGIPELSPTLVRWKVPPQAPPHLAIGLDRLAAARRGETVFIVAPDEPGVPLLERVQDARKVGATVMAIDRGASELRDVAHEWISVPGSGLLTPPSTLGGRLGSPDRAAARPPKPPEACPGSALVDPELSFETVQHLVSMAAGEPIGLGAGRRRGFRDRLARLLDAVSGPPPAR